jgi:tetratricopeptide (TPR) repeat protein
MLTALLAAALAVTPAERVQAERLARQSITDYNVGDFESALQEATAAYKLDPRPALLFNLGQVHRALHHWERAEFFFRGYLRGAPDAPNRAAVNRLIEEMEAKQAAAPPAAPPVAAAPAPRPAAPAPAAPAQVPLVIESQPAPVPPRAAPATPPVALAPPAAQPRTIEAVEPGVTGETAPPELQTRSHTAAYILGGVAIAAAGFGVAGLVERLRYDGWVNQVKGSAPGTYGYAPPLSQDQANIWTVAAYVLAGVTAAGVAGAIIAW